MKVLIIGSSGMVGSAVLKECLNDSSIKKITLINRRKEIKNRKVKEIIHTDFSDFSKIKKDIINHDVCFYCVGVYTGSVPKKEFIKITYDYFKAFAKTIESKKTTFCLFSAQGANANSKIMFAKWKGKCEEYLNSLDFKAKLIFRPGYIYPSDKEKRRKTLHYLALEIIFPMLNLLLPRYCITSRNLGKGMVKRSQGNPVSEILENIDIRRL